MKIFIIIIGTILSAILYRAGGMSKDDTAKPKWIPKFMRQTLWRDWGCSLVTLAVMYGIGIRSHYLVFICSFLAMWAFLTTYWDRVFGEDNFFAHGLMIGLALIPFIWDVSWHMIGFRALFMSAFMGVWCLLFKNDVVEEMGRGAVIVFTLVLLLFTTGCASTLNAKYDDQGRLVGLDANGQQESSVKQNADGTVEYKMNNKAEPLLKDLISINALKEN